MIKRVCFFRRRKGLSVADFQRHWLEDHGPLIAPDERRFTDREALTFLLSVRPDVIIG